MEAEDDTGGGDGTGSRERVLGPFDEGVDGEVVRLVFVVVCMVGPSRVAW